MNNKYSEYSEELKALEELYNEIGWLTLEANSQNHPISKIIIATRLGIALSNEQIELLKKISAISLELTNSEQYKALKEREAEIAAQINTIKNKRWEVEMLGKAYQKEFDELWLQSMELERGWWAVQGEASTLFAAILLVYGVI